MSKQHEEKIQELEQLLSFQNDEVKSLTEKNHEYRKELYKAQQEVQKYKISYVTLLEHLKIGGDNETN